MKRSHRFLQERQRSTKRTKVQKSFVIMFVHVDAKCFFFMAIQLSVERIYIYSALKAL